MRSSELAGVSIVVCCLLLAACENLNVTPEPAPCGTPPTTSTPVPAFLDYPPNGSANIPTSVGQIIETGVNENGPLPQTVIALQAIVGEGVLLGQPTSAPSPLPSPFAPPPLSYANEAYVAIPVPTLSPNTTYRVSDIYSGWTPIPPCVTGVSQTLGTFSTGSI